MKAKVVHSLIAPFLCLPSLIGRIGFADKPLASTAFGRLGTSFYGVRSARGVYRWPTTISLLFRFET